MDYKNRRILWGKDKLILVDKVSPHKIARAERTVKDALEGKIGFGYKQIEWFYHHGYNELTLAMKKIEHDRMTEQDESFVWMHTAKLAKLRKQRKALVTRDERALQQMRSTYERLKKALVFLVEEGYIESYTLRPNGHLTVNWFTEKGDTEIQVIEQGDTFKVEPPSATSIEYGDKIHYADILVKYDYDDHGVFRAYQPAHYHGVKPAKAVNLLKGNPEYYPYRIIDTEIQREDAKKHMKAKALERKEQTTKKKILWDE